MALNGIIQKTGTINGVGIIKYDSSTKCMVYYRDPESELEHTPGSANPFHIRTVKVIVRLPNGSSETVSEEIAILIRIENKIEVEEIDGNFEAAGGLTDMLRLNTAGGDDPPKADVPAGEEFAYRYGKIVQADEADNDRHYYFDRNDYPTIVETSTRPYFITKSAKFIDTEQKLNEAERTTTIEYFAKDISTIG